jgi:hypothetical protein
MKTLASGTEWLFDGQVVSVLEPFAAICLVLEDENGRTVGGYAQILSYIYL